PAIYTLSHTTLFRSKRRGLCERLRRVKARGWRAAQQALGRFKGETCQVDAAERNRARGVRGTAEGYCGDSKERIRRRPHGSPRKADRGSQRQARERFRREQSQGREESAPAISHNRGAQRGKDPAVFRAGASCGRTVRVRGRPHTAVCGRTRKELCRQLQDGKRGPGHGIAQDVRGAEARIPAAEEDRKSVV